MRTVFLDRQGGLRYGWRVLGFLVPLNLLGFLASPLIRSWPLPWQTFLPGRWLDLLIALFATWICVRLEGRGLPSIGLRLDPSFLGQLALGTVGGSLLITVASAGVWVFGGVHWIRTPGTGLTGLGAGAWFFLAVACFEEVVTRGYPFQRLVQGAGPWVAQGVVAGIFALAHWHNPGMHGATKAWATLNIGLASLLLGFCYLRTGSLALPIGVHLGWNWAQGSLLGFGVSGISFAGGYWTPVFQDRPEWLTGGAFGLEASLPCALACSAGILGLWRWKGRVSAGASTASAS